jgi:hypothetical protein
MFAARCDRLVLLEAYLMELKAAVASNNSKQQQQQ